MQSEHTSKTETVLVQREEETVMHTITLTLSDDEFKALVAVMGSIGRRQDKGTPESKATRNLISELYDAGCRWLGCEYTPASDDDPKFYDRVAGLYFPENKDD